MDINLLFSIFGLAGGLLCCVGDIFFDLKGPGNKKLGTSKNIDSNWPKMAEWRFEASILFALVEVIGVGFGFYSIVNQIYAEHSTLAVILAVTGYVGAVGGFFVHSVLCIQAVIYKRIMSGGEKNFELADHTLEGFYKAIMPPFFPDIHHIDDCRYMCSRSCSYWGTDGSEMDGAVKLCYIPFNWSVVQKN